MDVQLHHWVGMGPVLAQGMEVENLGNFPDFGMYRELGLQVVFGGVPARGMEFEEGGMGLLLY